VLNFFIIYFNQFIALYFSFQEKTNKMIRQEINGIHFLEFELFEQFPKLECKIILRHGGFSSGNFGSLNLSYLNNDDSENVFKNEQRLLSFLGLKNICRGILSHGKTIISADVSNKIENHASYDGIVTNKLNLGLLITHADCQSACFYDSVNHAVANVHCGWRGNIQNIYAETIEFMKALYGTKPENLFVGISPSLGPHYAQFVNYEIELPKSFWDFQINPQYFDFWEISKWQLKLKGILPEHIQVASICTYSNPLDFFSYRRDNITGRNATVCSLL
jgi:YfiH family protein